MPFPGITDADLRNWFTYHPPTSEQQVKYVAIRDAALNFARILLNNTPQGADQTAALRKLRESVMTGNQAIACELPHEGVGAATSARSTG